MMTFQEMKQAQQQARGLGDTVAIITQATGIDKLAEIYEKTTGKPCNCRKRQTLLNTLIPYK